MCVYLDYKPWDELYFHVGASAEKAGSDYTGWGFPTLTQLQNRQELRDNLCWAVTPYVLKF